MKIVCLGDSFTEGYMVRKSYVDFLADFGHEVINLGINGNRTSEMVQRFKAEDTDVLIIFGGSNDTFDALSPEDIFSNIKEIIKKSKARQNIVIIPPLMELEDAYPRYEINNRTINDLGNLIETLDITKVDARKIEPVYLDGLHMGEAFHRDLAEEIQKVLN